MSNTDDFAKKWANPAYGLVPDKPANPDLIYQGDVVQVNINCAQITISRAATVVACPRFAGDTWIFRDEETGYVHYVSEGCTVSKRIQSK